MHLVLLMQMICLDDNQNFLDEFLNELYEWTTALCSSFMHNILNNFKTRTLSRIL